MLNEERSPQGISRHHWVQLADDLFYSPITGRIASKLPPVSTGGFLCEEMGLGKTVISLSLVLENPQTLNLLPLTPNVKPTSATLIICPVSLVGQWIAEAKKFCPSLKTYMYHGTNRLKDVHKLAEFDLVLTTYQTLGSDYSMYQRGVANALQPILTRLHWHRIILDESHAIKNKKTGHSKACCDLKATHRWCATGTPFTSNLGDLEGQLAFLQLAPFDTEPSVFKASLLQSLESAMHMHATTLPQRTQLAIHLLRKCTIRHTKSNTVGGVQVLQLPPRTDRVVSIELSPVERALYDKSEKEALESFNQIMRRGDVAVAKATFALHSLMLPLRQICAGN